MKKFIQKNILTSMLGLILMMSINETHAQQSDYSISIIGKWELDFEKSIENADGTTKSTFDQLSSEVKERIKSNFDKQIVHFNQNGNYSLKSIEKAKMKGVWSFSVSDSTLLIDFESADVKQFKIISIQNNELKLEAQGDEGALFKNWYYNKTTN